MIKLVGLKNYVILVALLGFLLIVTAIYFGGIVPMSAEVSAELNGTKSAISGLQGKIAGLREDEKFLKENLQAYQALEGQGFLMKQDRFMIGRTMEDMRKKTSWLTLPYSVGDTQTIAVPNVDLAAIKHRLIDSRIEVRAVPVLLDTDVYVFLQELARVFPAHTRIQNFSVKRSREITRQSLVEMVANKKPASFFSADITFDWLTLVPEDVPPPVEAPR